MSAPVETELAAVSMYRRLSAEDRRRLASVSVLRSFDRGDEIFAEGDPGDAFFVVVEGRVKVVKSTPAGKEIILEIFGPGDPLGAVVAYEGKPFPATARALEPTRCVVTPRETFFRLLAEHPSLVRGLLSGLTMRLIELTNRLANLSGARVEERMARLFLQKVEELGRPERGGHFLPLALTRQELADLCGTTIETAIRVMSRWSKSGLVRTEDDGFTVLDRAELERLAGTG
ncbi:MAG TPA: Crp/Fnr family transcriptional regulator [Thermoanaerobaculia bacterium]|nr:Crp/Fnr family transcriptional regulator [Thermoanaerobaculia bacterium]